MYGSGEKLTTFVFVLDYTFGSETISICGDAKRVKTVKFD